jgi:hypothetical protein
MGDVSMDKDALELEKLKAEIDEIRLNLQTNRSTLRLEKFKVFPTYLAVAVTLIFGTITYFQQRQQYLDQQAREQRFKVSQEMITLVKELNTENATALQRNAALELAYFGRQAIPILIENLDIARKNDVNQAIIKSLKSIAMSEKDSKEKDEKNRIEVLIPLLESAENVFRQQLQADNQPDSTILLAHFEALGILGMLRSNEKELHAKTLATLKAVQGDVKRHANISTQQKNVLQEAIEKQLRRLAT